MIGVYSAIAYLVALFALPIVGVLALFSAKYRAGLGQRLGFYPAIPAPRRGARRIWFHCASVGEVQTAASLIDRLLDDPRFDVVLSTMTPTGNAVATERFGARCPVIFWPIEAPASVAAAFRAVRPDALVILETEIWPSVLDRARREGAGVAIVNARISDRTTRRYGFLGFFLAPLLRSVSVFAVQSGDYAKRLFAMGVRPETVAVTGNLKFDLGLTRDTALAQPSFLDGLDAGGAPVVCFASTHEGEEEAALAAFARVRREIEGVRCVIAPRHPERSDAVATLVQRAGYTLTRRSRLAAGEPFSSDVILLDTVGELVRAMARCAACFVGGSLVSVGGHNVLEPAALGVPVLFGKHMENFRDAEEVLLSVGGAVRVRDAGDLGLRLVELLTDVETARTLADRAARAVDANRGATERTLAAIERLLAGDL